MQHAHSQLFTATRNSFTRTARRADRDLAEQMKVAQRLSAEIPPVAPRRPPERVFFKEEEMQDRLSVVRATPGAGSAMVDARLKRAAHRGPMRVVSIAPDPARLMRLQRDFPNFADATKFIQAHLALCRAAGDQVLQLPPILLAGPPGVGKTMYATSLGELLETPVVETQVSTLSADFSLGGLDSSYESAKPGVIWDALDGDTMSPMIVLDELDKLPSRSDGALGCLYRLLERHSAKRFADQAILLPVDASHIQWIATCNDPDAVEPALRSRFHLIEIRPPTAEQRAATVHSVNKALLRDSVWASAFDGRLSASVIERLGDMSPRLVRQTLELAYAKAALAGRRRIEVKDLEGLRTTLKRAIGFV